MNYEDFYSLPFQKLQHKQVLASLFCRSLNNVHKGCILVNKLLHRQYSFLPACIEKETARVKSNISCLSNLLSFCFYGTVLFFILLKISMTAHRWVSNEQDRHKRLTPHFILREVAEHGKHGVFKHITNM